MARTPGEKRTTALHVFNIWVILGAIVFACFLLCFSIILLWVTRPDPASNTGGATAVLSITEAPTATPQILTATAVSDATIDPTEAASSVGSQSDDIVIGARVQIKGTGGDGLRLRSDPGLDNDVRLVGSEAEVFLVNDGPVEIDDYTWWYLIGLYDETRVGWAVSIYLSVIQNP
jgi:hypothetical protein